MSPVPSPDGACTAVRSTKASQVGMRHLLVVHQGAEMYGSDRSLLEVLSGLDRTAWRCTVCVPESGPLVSEFTRLGFVVHVLPLVKIERKLFTPAGLFRLPAQVLAALRGLDRITHGSAADVVYSNTLAVWAGALWARRRGVPHVWHVREIIRYPTWVARAMRGAAQSLAQRLICNSLKTQAWLDERQATDKLTVRLSGMVLMQARRPTLHNDRRLAVRLG